MLYPTGLRIHLLMLFLGKGNHLAGPVEYHAAGAGGALIDGNDVAKHFRPASVVRIRRSSFIVHR
jgi:hypothetical protein